MEQGNSRQLFIHLIKDILKARGAKVEQQQVQEFLRVCRAGVPVVFRAQDLGCRHMEENWSENPTAF